MPANRPARTAYAPGDVPVPASMLAARDLGDAEYRLLAVLVAFAR